MRKEVEITAYGHLTRLVSGDGRTTENRHQVPVFVGRTSFIIGHMECSGNGYESICGFICGFRDTDPNPELFGHILIAS